MKSFNTLAATNLLLVVIALLLATLIPSLRFSSDAQAQTDKKTNYVYTQDTAVSAANDRIATAVEKVATSNLEVAKANTAIAKALENIAKALGNSAADSSAPTRSASQEDIKVEVGK
ncbi:hypothetical protein GX645_05455 [Candidatus Sumerlaeota bacterium]|nr:hypothetical protein [Candidatus Sumerlaeales bacterium]NLD61882.1 hypothetical protein [Candidatus Sumerlaeota bacterium]